MLQRAEGGSDMRIFLIIVNVAALLAYGKFVLLAAIASRHTDALVVFMTVFGYLILAANAGYIFSTKPAPDNIFSRFGRSFISAWKSNSKA